MKNKELYVVEQINRIASNSCNRQKSTILNLCYDELEDVYEGPEDSCGLVISILHMQHDEILTQNKI